MAEENPPSAITPEMRERHAYHKRMCAARKAPKSSSETRLALFIAERGITEAELKPFYRTRRKGGKPRFDYHAFAYKYDIDLDWLWEGDLRGLQRTEQKRPGPRTVSSRIARAQKRELQESLSMVPAENLHEVLALARRLAAKWEAKFAEE
jgi:hypothetical protein